MVEEIITPRYKKVLPCPCCKRPIKIMMRYLEQYIEIEPIHADTCSICGKTTDKIAIHHEAYVDDNPTAFTRFVCGSCHAKIHWKGRPTLNETIQNMLKERGLDD